MAVRLSVLDPLGREVTRPVDAALPAGAHEVRVDVSSLRSGAYLIRLTAAGGESLTRRLVVTR
jgi:hypothetical protein